MNLEPVRVLSYVRIELDSAEANDLYNEIYRVARISNLGTDFPALSAIYDALHNDAGVDGTA